MQKLIATLITLAVLSTFGVFAGGQQEQSTTAAAAEPVEVTWWSTQDVHEAVLSKFAEQFSSENPNITVKFVLPAAGAGPNQYTAKYMATFVAGNPPDLIDMGQTKPGEILNHLRALDELGDLEADLTISDIPEGIFPFGDLDGHTYAIPLYARALGLYYNKDMYSEAGLSPDRGPESLEELREFAQKISKDTDGDGNPDKWGYFVSHGPVLPSGLFWFTHLWRHGGTVLNADWSKAAFNGPAGVNALEYYRSLIDRKIMPLQPETSNFNQTFDLFLRQSSAMIDSWSENATRLADVDWNWGTAPQPLTESDGTKVSFVGGNAITIPQKASEPEAAYEFVKWFLSPDVHVDWATQGGFLPIRAKDTDTPEYQEWLESATHMRAFTTYFAWGRNRPAVEGLIKIQSATAEAIEKTMFGVMSPKDALDEAAETANAVLAGN